MKSCKDCKWAIWGNRTDIPEHERKFWGDCTQPGPVPAVYHPCYIMAANVEENCPTWETK